MLEIDRATVVISATLSVGFGIAIGWALRGRGRTTAANAVKKAVSSDVRFSYVFGHVLFFLNQCISLSDTIIFIGACTDCSSNYKIIDHAYFRIDLADK